MSVRLFIKHLTRKTLTRTLSQYSLPVLPRQQPPAPPPPPPECPDNDPYVLMKEDPIEICSTMWVKCFSSPTMMFNSLSGSLLKFDLWVLAYQRTCAHVTGTFPSRQAIRSNTLHHLLSLRNAVVHGHFLWNDKVEPLIRSPNDRSPRILSNRKLQALLASDEPCFQDRIVQEVLLMILEPVFEPRFSPKSHAFRPKRNAHTVIRTIRSNFAGYLWFLRGDLSEVFDHLDRNVVMGCLENVVKDKKMLGLVNAALKTPVAVRPHPPPPPKESDSKKKATKKRILNANDPKPDPYWLRTFYDFAPEEALKVPSYGCCGILSPLLANICLDELDKFMEDMIVEFFRPSEDNSIRKDSITDGSHNPSWPEFVPTNEKDKTRKMDYIRHGGHFLIGIRGPRSDAVDVRKKVREFCQLKFGLSFEGANVEIEHITRGIKFLDHIITLRVIRPTLHYTASGGNIVSKKGVGTLLSVTASLQQCIRHFRRLQLVKGDSDPEPLPCRPMLYSGQAHTNSQMNKFLETMADWYRYADNRKKVVGFCAYVIRSSLAKLYAARYRLKSRAKVYGIASRNLSGPLKEKSNNAAPEYSDLLRMGLVDVIEGVQFSRMSMIPSCDYTPFPRNWVPDHERVLREYIKLDDPKYFFELHRSVKKHRLTLPQEELSQMVWDFKTLGVKNDHHHRRRRPQNEARNDESLEEVAATS